MKALNWSTQIYTHYRSKAWGW